MHHIVLGHHVLSKLIKLVWHLVGLVEGATVGLGLLGAEECLLHGLRTSKSLYHLLRLFLELKSCIYLRMWCAHGFGLCLYHHRGFI
jgi:hypothetical protein